MMLIRFGPPLPYYNSQSIERDCILNGWFTCIFDVMKVNSFFLR